MAKDQVLERARGLEGTKLNDNDGKGREVSFPRQNPGDSVHNRPAKDSPNVSTNTK